MLSEQKRENALSSVDTEMSVIGSVFINYNSLVYAVSQLDDKDFYNKNYSKIFQVVKHHYEKNGNIDRFEVEAYLKTHENSNADKLINEINKSTNFCNPSNIENYCRNLKQISTRREIYRKSIELQSKALDTDINEGDLYKEIDKIKEVQYRSNPEIARTSTQIKKDSKGDQPLLDTGIKEWDEWFYSKGGRGLGTTELIFARPGHGKTFYLFKKVGAFAMQNNIGLHFHLEDTDIEASERIDAVIPPSMYRELNDNILVIDKHKYLHDIVKDIRYYKHKYGIKWVSIDHMGRIQVAGFRADNILAAQIESTRELTDLFKELNIHGCITIQPNKSYKGRSGWDNLLREEDLKGATEIFEDAFVVTTLLRPNIYPELRVGVGSDSAVKSPDGKEVHYDSIFVTQLKNRRQRIVNEFLHMVQKDNAIYTEREFRNKFSKESEVDNNVYEDQAPF